MKNKFTYDFIIWVLAKYKLSNLVSFANNAGWEKNTVYGWKTRGLPTPLLCLLQEKLINLRTMGRISCCQNVNLDDLFKEYQTEIKK